MYFDLPLIIQILSLALHVCNMASLISLALRLGSGLILGQFVQSMDNVTG